MINVNFSKLKRTNPDVVGQLKVNDTNINYLFSQGNNNKYYLTHSFNANITYTGNILTLSTCYNNSDKTLVYAKLIKKKAKQ